MEMRAVTLGDPNNATLVAVGDLFLKVLARIQSNTFNGCKGNIGVPMASYNQTPSAPNSTTPGSRPGEGRAD
jgi:hypothetical protein